MENLKVGSIIHVLEDLSLDESSSIGIEKDSYFVVQAVGLTSVAMSGFSSAGNYSPKWNYMTGILQDQINENKVKLFPPIALADLPEKFQVRDVFLSAEGKTGVLLQICTIPRTLVYSIQIVKHTSKNHVGLVMGFSINYLLNEIENGCLFLVNGPTFNNIAIGNFLKAIMEPKNNDGRSKCFWCGNPTRQIELISSFGNVCTECGK